MLLVKLHIQRITFECCICMDLTASDLINNVYQQNECKIYLLVRTGKLKKNEADLAWSVINV